MLAFSKRIGNYLAMNHVKIALFDDEELTYNEVREALTESSHSLESWASTRQWSLETLDEVYAGKISIDAVLLDGKMDSGDFSDAIAIEQHARKLFGRSLPIIGWSVDIMAGVILPIPREYDLGKMAVTRLVPFLDEMPETVLERLPQ